VKALRHEDFVEVFGVTESRIVHTADQENREPNDKGERPNIVHLMGDGELLLVQLPPKEVTVTVLILNSRFANLQKIQTPLEQDGVHALPDIIVIDLGKRKYKAE
jgi:hypothetical protein